MFNRVKTITLFTYCGMVTMGVNNLMILHNRRLFSVGGDLALIIHRSDWPTISKVLNNSIMIFSEWDSYC